MCADPEIGLGLVSYNRSLLLLPLGARGKSNRSGQRVTRDSSGRRCSCRCELASWHGGRGQGPHPHRSARVAKSPGTPKILGCMPSSTGPNPQIRIRLDRGLSRWTPPLGTARIQRDPARSGGIWEDLGRLGRDGGAQPRAQSTNVKGASDPTQIRVLFYTR